MNTRILTVLIFVIFSSILFAQNKIFTINEAVIGQSRELRPETLVNLQWRGNNNSIVYQDYYIIYERSIPENIEKELVLISDINNSLQQIKHDTLSALPMVNFINKNELSFEYNNTIYTYSIQEKTIVNNIDLPKNAQEVSGFANNTFAFCIDNNVNAIYKNGEVIKITEDIDPNIVNGQSVSRNEFGISNGLFWSKSGNKLAFYRKDNSKVENYPLVDITAREAKEELIKYPMAGMKSEHVSLGVYDFSTNTTVFIEKQDTISEKYLTNISWDLKDEFIYIQVLNRAQNEMHLVKYDVLSGKAVDTLFSETHKKYVEPQHPLMFITNNKFIYQTRANGYNHAYLYKTNGELIKQITDGEWEITEMHGTDGKYIYYSATKESPIEQHAYRTNISNGKTDKLTHGNGKHIVEFNPKFSAFIDNYSNTEVPRVIATYKNDGTLTCTIKESPNPLTEYNMPEVEIGTIKSADGETDLYYRLIKPSNFDSTKSYPAIIYVYGGPHVQLITDSWLAGARMWNYFMAQKGYVMLTVDNRGSANRGLEFENVIHRRCGVNEMDDQIQGVKLLQGLPYVNKDKIGVHGWSYGGFMTTSLMVNYPDVFKVGCAGGPVIDWKYYEIMYGERYMDSPQENPQGYTVTSLIPKAKELKGKLLMVHGAIDPVVVMQHSQLFVRECIKNNIPIDYFIYPRAKHNVRGKDRVHLMQKVTDYFDDYLK